MTSTIIGEISRSDLQHLKTPSSASITNVKQLSSYNWIDAPVGKPTIAVPGSPSRWSPPNGSRRLPKDQGRVYIAQNAYRHPESPLEPLFRALYTSNPSYDIQSVDVVTDRNNIRKLLSYVKSGVALETFTITVEVMKNTAIFCRDETRTYEDIGPSEFKGYGHEFEKAYTRDTIEGSTGHHRIISYRFGNLNFIVRHETDGHTKSNSSIGQGQGSDSLASMFESLSVAPAKAPNTTLAGSIMQIRKEGDLVPLESTLEIKTRVSHRPLDFKDVATQLWVSQTPQLVRAYHYKGTFGKADVEDVASQIKSWEEDNQSDLMKLAALLEKIISVVRGGGGKAVIRYDSYGDRLVLEKRVDGTRMLPEDLYVRWDGENASGGSGAENNEH